MAAVLLTGWARLLIDSLVQSGVQDAVISPGSRSTPFTWAALQHRQLTCHSVIDERSAAFFALGHARYCQRPVLLICTSGSAPAHYFPAIVEACYSGIPLIVLSADRPIELLYRAAPQTIEQVELYGKYVRKCFDLGEPSPSASALSGLQAVAAQAVSRASAPDAGPVHLNARAHKPLAPILARTREDEELASAIDALIERGPTRFSASDLAISAQALDALTKGAGEAERGLIVCGALSALDSAATARVLELAEVSGFPVLAEAPSQLVFDRSSRRVCTHFDAYLRARPFVESKPDLVIELGQPLTSSGWLAYQQFVEGSARHVVAPRGWPDVCARARWLHAAEVGPTAARLTERLTALPNLPTETQRARAKWFETWWQADARTARMTEQTLAELPFGEAHAVREVCDRLPEGSLLVLGNSLPIRAVDAFARKRARGIKTLVQRGTNGIDGLVSGAAGSARSSGLPTTLLIGDVSLAHDIGGLALCRSCSVPLVIVVLDNAGGRIFDELPWGDAIQATERERAFWLTPPALDWAALARGYGLAYRSATTASELAESLSLAYARAGATLICVEVAPDSYHQAITGVRQATALEFAGEPA